MLRFVFAWFLAVLVNVANRPASSMRRSILICSSTP